MNNAIEDLFMEKYSDIVSYISSGEPDTDSIESVLKLARDHRCDIMISAGGGSVVDTGKAVSALLTNKGNLLDYLEVVGKGLPLKKSSKPFIAIPTTAGTGSEVTKNAVIGVPSSGVKVSMRSVFMLPLIALVDPLLTISLPPNVTASTGMDAFTQVIEPYVSKRANPMTDIFCRDAIKRAAMYLKQAFIDGDDIEARENMSWVSLLGGLSLANAGLGAVHGFAGVIGGMFKAPHGVICASLLPAVIEVNIAALSKINKYHPVLDKYRDITEWVTGISDTRPEELVDWFRELYKFLKIPGLSSLGVRENDLNLIIQKSKNASSMKANPVELSDDELMRILEFSY
jgi:alcohol dehydrogenase class IV